MLPCVRAEGPFVCKAGIKSQLSQRLSFYLSSRRLKVPDSIFSGLPPLIYLIMLLSNVLYVLIISYSFRFFGFIFYSFKAPVLLLLSELQPLQP